MFANSFPFVSLLWGNDEDQLEQLAAVLSLEPLPNRGLDFGEGEKSFPSSIELPSLLLSPRLNSKTS